MYRSRLRVIHFCSPLRPALVLVLASCLTAAQVDEKSKAQEKLERQKNLKLQALVLLDEVANGVSSLKLPENRSYVLASTADLFWDHDEKRARALFWESLNTINILVESVNKRSSKSDLQNAYFSLFGLRKNLLRLVARRDPELALELLRTTRLMPPEQTTFRFPDDLDLEQQIASEAAARDPQRALQLARDSLARGITFELFNLLLKLNDLDQALGSKFAGNVIDKLKTENIANDVYASHIAAQLLISSRKREAESVRLSSGYPQIRQLKLDDVQRRELTELIANAALGLSAKEPALYAVTQIKPELEEFAPERIRLLENKVSELNRRMSKEQRAWNDYNDIVVNGTPEDIFRAANRADSEQRLMLEQQAIITSLLKGKADSLRELINNEINDESRRKSLLDSLDSAEIDQLIYCGDTVALQKVSARIRRKEERARAMAQLAIMLEEKGEHDEALKLLGEAETLVKVDFQSETKSNALLSLLLAYALVEPSKAFTIVERTIDRANDEVSKAALVDKIKKTGFFKKGEIILQQSEGNVLDFMLFRYGKGVTALANADFTRTKAAVDRFHRNELRIMGRLLIAQALLRPETVYPSKPVK